MATNPTSKNASFAFLEAQNVVALNDRRARLGIRLSTAAATIPAVADTNLGGGAEGNDALFHPRATALNVGWRLSTRSADAVNNNAPLGVGLFLFRDNADGEGNALNRVFFLNLNGAQEPSRLFEADAAFISRDSGTTTIVASHFVQPGTYKVVPVMWNILNQSVEDDNTPPRAQDVNNGNTECYVDGDNNVASSGGVGSNPTLSAFVTGRVAWVRVEADVQSLAPANPSTDQKYGDTPDITYDLTSNTLNTTLKQIRVGPIQPSAATTTAPVKVLTQTPQADGTRPAVATYNVDSLFPASSTAHTLRLHVGPRGGQASTPAGEIPALLDTGTLVIPDTNDKAWLVFGTPASGFTRKDAYTVERNATFNIGSGITIYQDSALTTLGVAAYESSAYTTARRLFRRQQPTAGFNDAPHFEAFVVDAFGQKIESKSFIVRTQRHSDFSNEDSQTITSGTGGTVGRLRWNYTIAATHTAFNRFKKAAGDNPQSAPATFTGSPVAGPHPAYPKRHQTVGNAYSGTNEPSVLFSNVIGLNSEIHFEDMWTGDLADATVDGNGEPTGKARLTKNLGTGAMRFKLATTIDRTTGDIENAGEHNPKTVDGQSVPVTVTANNLKQRWAAYDRTVDVVETSPVNSNISLSSATGYATTPTSGFESKEASGDPRTLNLVIGASDDATQRGTFDLSGDPENNGGFGWDRGVVGNGNVGFTGDTNNYGYLVVRVQFIAVDPDLVILVAIEQDQVPPGESTTITAKFGRYLPTAELVELLPDAAPNIKVARVTDPADPLLIVADDSMDPINPDISGNSSDWRYEFTPSDAGAFTVLITCLIQGSRPPASGRATFGAGGPAAAIRAVGSISKKPPDTGTHLVAGDQVRFGLDLVERGAGLREIDVASAAVTILRKVGEAGAEFLDTDLAWKATPVGSEIPRHTLTLTGDRLHASLLLTTDDTWNTENVTALFLCTSGGAVYTDRVIRELVSKKNRHDREAFDPTGLFK